MNQYKQIFTYLKAFAKLRNRPIYDIELSQQYQNIWLDSIADNEVFYNALHCDDSKRDYWLNFNKPKQPQEPKPITPPALLVDWVNEKSLYDENAQPLLKEEIILEGETLYIKDHQELHKTLNDYIDNNWPDELLEYQDKKAQYQSESTEYKKLLKTYQKVFKFYEQVRDNSDTHELVVGVGLFNYKEDNDSKKYYRHIITQIVDIGYKQSAITIKVSDDDPKIEKNFIPDEFQTSIKDAVEYFDLVIKDETIDDIDLLDKQNIETILTEIANQIGIEQYYHNINKPTTSTQAVISYAPSLILRKKTTSKLDEAYTKIIEQVEQQGDNHNIELIDTLLGNNNQSNTNNDTPSNNVILPEIIYFPNPSNKEQAEILEKSNNNNAVVVQGPPGTGKSHTIANLMCHLLATGNRVLATAYTKRALEVLKGKLPEAYQSLVVNYLGNDQASKQDLTASVNGIQKKINNPNYQTINEQEQLTTVRKQIAQDSNKHKTIIRQDTTEITINTAYSGMLVEVLEQLKTNKTLFSWYKDNYDDFNDQQLLEQLKRFIDSNQIHQFKQSSDFEDIADLNKLPTPNQVERYNELLRIFLSLEKRKIIKSNDLEILANQLKEIDKLSEQIQALYHGQSLDEFLALHDEASRLDELIKTLPEQAVLKQLDDTKINYPDKDLTVLKAQAKTLLDFLNDDGKLQNLSRWEKWRLPADITERYHFVDAVKVNESPCDTVDEFNTVIQDLKIKQILQKLQDTHPINKNSYVEQVDTYLGIIDKSKQFNTLKKQADDLISGIFDSSNINVEYLESNNITELLERIEWTKLNNEWEGIKIIIDEANDYLIFRESRHYLDAEIDFEQPGQYQEIYNKVETLNNFKELQENLSQRIPNTIKQILAGDTVTVKQLNDALYYKHAKNYTDSLSKEDTQTLKHRIKENQDEEKKLISKIGSNKAWQGVLEYVSNNQDLKTELKLWQDAIIRVSNTNSKRSQKYRKIAKQKMDKCKDIIPCWIMPLQQLADTITPKQGMYDYIIIDEASQLGIDAMLLLYLAKKIIIVGDNQQTAPENIGIKTDEVGSLINEHLAGIPNKAFYDSDHSFFDLANIYFHQIITLREHFRCMPEIIEFSNQLCYVTNTPLYALRNYSENRLTPLEHYFCDSGLTEGTGSNIINKPEAQALVDKIAKIIKDDNYQGKTIGVITLQGNAQKEIIHNLLLEKIGKEIDEKEYTARKIVVGNAASFQGDERDIILLSLVTAHNHERRALTSDTDKRRFNVAASRAKDQVWLFHSVQLPDLINHNDLRYKLLEHISTYGTPEFEQRQLITVPSPKPMYGDEPKAPQPFRSWFEVEVYNDILTKGYKVKPAYKVAGYEIDLVPLCADGTKIAVECDGDYWHGEEQYDKDMVRQEILERSVWQFFRIRYSDYIRDKHQATQGLWALLAKHSIKPKIVEKVKNNLTIDNIKKVEKIPQQVEKIALQSEIIKSASQVSIFSTENQTQKSKNNPIIPNTIFF